MILTEWTSFNQANVVLEEGEEDSSTKKKNLYLRGVFIQGGVRNLNGRIYPVHEIAKAVEDINSILSKGESVLGECDHPEKLTINLDRVSHMINSMWMDGNLGYGKLKILPTDKGNIIRTLIEAGVKLGVSSRGSGDVNDQGIVSDFEIVTVDIVAKPSAPDAYPKPVYEALNSRRGLIIDDLAKAVAHDPKAQKHLHRELLEWINKQ
jgi:hypothetical protein